MAADTQRSRRVPRDGHAAGPAAPSAASPPHSAAVSQTRCAALAEFGPTVLGYLMNSLGDRGAAEDVHQQVFLEVWQGAG